MTHIELTVSIVVYKPKMEQLQQTLNSLCKTPLQLQILLSDNSPSPLDMAQLTCSKPLKYTFNGKNLGFGRAHNQNLLSLPQAQSHGYFLVLNPDVYFDGKLISELLIRMQQDPEIGLCIPQICHPSGKMQLINRRVPRPTDLLVNFLSCKFKTELFKTESYNWYQLKDVEKNKTFLCPTISGCFMFFRADAFVENNGFDERYFLYLEDTDLSRRISEQYRTVVFSDLTAYHHWSRGAYRNLTLFFIFLQSMVLYFNKWGWVRDPLREALNKQVDYYELKQKKSQSPAHNSVLHSAQL